MRPMPQWLITDERIGPDALRLVRRLPAGSGVIVRERRLLRPIRRLSALRGLKMTAESRRVVRVSRLTPSRSSMRVTSLDSADGVSPRSTAAAAKLPRSTTRTKAFISADAALTFMNSIHGIMSYWTYYIFPGA